jgi:hypothetical protein
MTDGIILIMNKRQCSAQSIKRTKKAVNKFTGSLISKQFYNVYGKVLRVMPGKLFKRALIFDTVIPLTFFIPVILAGIVYVVTGGKEFIINRGD